MPGATWWPPPWPRPGRAWLAQVWDAQRLRQDDPVLVRSEVWTHARPDQGWAPLVTEPGLPKPGTVERVLLIEPYDGETAFIRFGCAIQGQVSPAILDQIRPDLGPLPLSTRRRVERHAFHGQANGQTQPEN